MGERVILSGDRPYGPTVLKWREARRFPALQLKTVRGAYPHLAQAEACGYKKPWGGAQQPLFGAQGEPWLKMVRGAVYMALAGGAALSRPT